ncbi:YoaK family protein [Flavobacterium sp. KACC 22761]|uniref:YoaK family protein n=1 Tax=Flavobacterium sp. KACC 22761 TaxID=3092665 RepID=UPI002A755951|nr:YoaK family protein [Flavobacterium sp. KACC 22761]WPO78325.1 YoaK family protein [Flavobacterium sp. KACC 22761]
MELQQKNIWYVTLLLTMVAGYCDTVTFVAADSIFSAHVTGNFIVFAYQIIKGYDIHAWVKLLTFPVFIIAVIAGGRIALKATNRYTILFWEGVILILSGITACLFGYLNNTSEWAIYAVAMATVFAMGLQNAFGKLYAKETHGPTTMMTGNVTQASLDLGNLLKNGLKDVEVLLSFKKQLVTIIGFLIGCFMGAVAGKFFGLGTLILPGTAMVICYWYHRES